MSWEDTIRKEDKQKRIAELQDVNTNTVVRLEKMVKRILHFQANSPSNASPDKLLNALKKEIGEIIEKVGSSVSTTDYNYTPPNVEDMWGETLE